MENENAELRSELAKASNNSRELCSAAAKAYFTEHWERDKNTLLLTYTNHYSEKRGHCYIVVQDNYMYPNGKPVVSMAVADVHEGDNILASYAEHEMTHLGNGPAPRSRICVVEGTSCNSEEEFLKAIQVFRED